jgi:hypothetical protein
MKATPIETRIDANLNDLSATIVMPKRRNTMFKSPRKRASMLQMLVVK